MGTVITLKEPPRAPFEKIFHAMESDTVLTLSKPSGHSWKQMTLPADYANNKLYGWNQEELLKDHFGRIYPIGTDDDTVDALMGKVGTMLINSGSSVKLRSANTWANNSTILNAYNDQSDWILDTTNHKWSLERYLDNQLQKVSATVINACDVTTDWANSKGTGTLAIDTVDKQEGTGSLYTTDGVSDASGYCTYIYNPASVIDMSGKEFLEFWIKSDLAGQVYVKVTDNQATPAYKEWDDAARFTVGAATWTRFVLPIKASAGTTGSLPSTVSGTLDLANIDSIEVGVRGVTVSTACDIWVDDVNSDVGQWVKVEAFVPDELISTVDALNIYAWDGTTYQKFLNVNPESAGGTLTEGNLYFTDGGDAADYYGTGLGAAAFLKDTRGQTVNRTAGDSNAGAITYSSYYGVKNRIGFAIKMPPSDGKQSATAGSSQVKLKLEVYYDDLNGTTVKDLSGMGNHGTIAGADKVTGKIEDGWNGTVNLPNNALLNDLLEGSNEFTIVLWAKLTPYDTGSSWRTFITLSNWKTGLPHNAFRIFFYWYGTSTSTRTFVKGHFHQQGVADYYSTWDNGTVNNFNPIEVCVMLTKDSNRNITLYIDNVQKSSIVIPDVDFSNEPIYTCDPLLDYTAELMFFNRVLTSDERTTIYNSGNGKVLNPAEETGLVGYWRAKQEHWGAATYEFENSSSTYYGLTNWNNGQKEPYLALYDPTTKDIDFYTFSKRPVGLEVRADENEIIDRVQLTLTKGTRVFYGRLRHSLLTRDSDSDNVPDFLDGGKAVSIPNIVKNYLGDW